MGQRSSKSNPSHVSAPTKSIIKGPTRRAGRPPKITFANTGRNPNGTRRRLAEGRIYNTQLPPINATNEFVPNTPPRRVTFINKKSGVTLPKKKDGEPLTMIKDGEKIPVVYTNDDLAKLFDAQNNTTYNSILNGQRQLKQFFPHGRKNPTNTNIVRAALYDEGEYTLTPFRPQPSYIPKYNRINKATFPPQLARATVTNYITGGARKTRRRRHSRK